VGILPVESVYVVENGGVFALVESTFADYLQSYHVCHPLVSLRKLDV
jgi:hypothetical protein